MPWSTTDITIAKTIEKTHSELSDDSRFVVLELLHQSYQKRKKTSVHLPLDLAQHVIKRLHTLKSSTEGAAIALPTPVDEVMLATIEKSFNELSPAAQENVAKVFHLGYLATMKVTRKQLAQLTRKLRG